MSLGKLIFTGEFISQNDDFKNQCECIIQKFNESDDILQTGRNTLKRICFEDEICVVKSFFIPRFPQDYSYGLFSKSKAKKSFDNGMRLLDLGFKTPEPIAYFEHRSLGKLRQSYYVCEFAANTTTLHSILNDTSTTDQELIIQFTTFCYNLHRNGILHRDFNPKNILISKEADKYQFSLVDINRITWSKPLPLSKSVGSLSRLPLDDAYKSLMLDHYSKLTNTSVQQCNHYIEKAINKTQRYFRNKKRIRKLFPKK